MAKITSKFDEFCSEILSTRALRRLGEITFLGAIDFVQPSNGSARHRRRHYRLEHSRGVADLISKYCDRTFLPDRERLHLLAAGLLHDTGHGPLSHTLESIFKTEFEIDHHSVGLAHILGTTKFGEEIASVFLKWQIDREYVAELVSANIGGSFSPVFGSSHNVDTLEGITRSMAMVKPSSTHRSADSFLERVWLNGEFDFEVGDEFWFLKNEVYSLLINGAVGRVMDAIAKSYMKSRISDFAPKDFMLGEGQFKKRHGTLFGILNSARSGRLDIDLLDSKMLQTELEFVTRQFVIDKNSKSLTSRYLQKKSRKIRPLNSVLQAFSTLDAHQLEMSL